MQNVLFITSHQKKRFQEESDQWTKMMNRNTVHWHP